LGTTPCWKKNIYFKIRRFWAETQLAMKWDLVQDQ
jgi:hypothetical protein